MGGEITELTRLAVKAKILRIFTDYDGTLAEFAKSPGIVASDQSLISLMQRLVTGEGILPAVISGRRLGDLEALLPVDGLLLGASYGIEMRLPDGRLRSAVPLGQIRPFIERILPHWKALVQGREGFYLEDKGWSLALHAKFAVKDEAESVLGAAKAATEAIGKDPRFKLLTGDRFLEILPHEANKALAVKWVLDELTPKDPLVLYLGDDEKDEEAFAAVLGQGGFAVHVGTGPSKTCAQFTLAGPTEVRAWLAALLDERNA